MDSHQQHIFRASKAPSLTIQSAVSVCEAVHTSQELAGRLLLGASRTLRVDSKAALVTFGRHMSTIRTLIASGGGWA